MTKPPKSDVTSELTVVQDGPVRRITMARSERRNALSRSLVAALHQAIATIEESGETRVVVLSGDGPVFCAGGDIAEYRELAEGRRSGSEAGGLADLLAAMTSCPVPVVARVHGAAYGGAIGLICAADIAIASATTRFSLSEARLGLVPAMISPYVISAFGWREAKAQMLLAAPFDADDALRFGLIQRIAPEDHLDSATSDVVAELLRSAPGALALIKSLRTLVDPDDPAASRSASVGLLLERLTSAEGLEGLQAFLEKRTPAWAPERLEKQ